MLPPAPPWGRRGSERGRSPTSWSSVEAQRPRSVLWQDSSCAQPTTKQPPEAFWRAAPRARTPMRWPGP
eukprot:13330099-Alexandrium_andersonii.AAC.1